MSSRREVHVIVFDSSGFDSVNFCQVFWFSSVLCHCTNRQDTDCCRILLLCHRQNDGTVVLQWLEQAWGHDWLVGYVGLIGPLRQYFSLYRAVSQREGERREMIDERKMSKLPHPHLLQVQ